jgi:WhiB family redox-sensing transcriptional regulator
VKRGLNDVNWHEDAECAKPENANVKKLFFSNVAEEKYTARNLCFKCPVRWNCLKYALETKQIHGVWGGKDEGEIRRALSVSHTGQEIRRQRFPNCPYCGSRPSKLKVLVAESPEGGRWKTMKLVVCEECDFTWRSRTSANAVIAYHHSRSEKTARKERAKKKAADRKAAKSTKQHSQEDADQTD